MRKHFANLHLDQPDSDLLNRLFFVQQVCIVLVLQINGAALLVHLFAPLRQALPHILIEIPLYSAIASFACAVSLLMVEPGRSRQTVLLGRALATGTAGAAAGVFAVRLLIAPAVLVSFLQVRADGSSHPSYVTPAVFALLAAAILLVRCRRPMLSAAADLFSCALSLAVVFLVLVWLFSTLESGDAFAQSITAPPTVVSLLLLAIATLLRRAEYGVLSFFLGYGMGSRIGRTVLPALFLFPFLLELSRSAAQSANVLPQHALSAFFTTCAMLLGALLLFLMASRINSMQREIQDLTLRDELTGLHNVRGFYLLAEQALLLAKRAGTTYGVLFVDLDNLKQINDTLGHAAGSTMLVETARLLRSTFRDTDVIGRVGGDEFVVAGQFEEETIAAAMTRLQASARAKAAESTRPFPLSFSMGYAPILGHGDSLKQLVMRADQAMYDNKRRKKMLATA